MAANLLSMDASQYATSRVLAQLNTVVSPSNLIGTTIAGAIVSRQVSSDNWFELIVDQSSSVAQVMQGLQARSDVLAASPDFVVHASLIPDDPSYASLWGMENTGAGGRVDADIDASQAWDYGTSTSVVVAVIDSGIDYNHVDLAANIWTNSGEVVGNGIDDDRNGYVDDLRGWNFVSNNNNPMDDNGHGTHVAGTIGAVGNNGVGVTGVAWNVKVMALKFLDASGSGSLSDAVAAVDYARTNGAKIINASWGGGGFSSALQSAIQRFQNSGGIFVAAAGNESSNNAAVASYPANYPLTNVISVAASTQSDTLASFSNYGTNVDIVAPGSSILSTIPGNRYARYSGTSMASPHVAGALALLWGQAPSQSATQLIDLVMQNTDNVLRDRSAYGRLNLGKAAAAIQSNDIPDDIPASTHVYTTTGPIAIQDATSSRVGTTLIAIDVADSLVIRDINVNVSIDHTYVSDLRIRLIAPDGSSVQLVNRRGGSKDNLRVVFDDEATQGISAVTGNLSGVFRPEASLSLMDGKNASGRWRLEIIDLARLDAGRFNSVALEITATSTASQAAVSTATTSNQNGNGNGNSNGNLASLIDWIEQHFRRIRVAVPWNTH